jgi:hypothetical protein
MNAGEGLITKIFSWIWSPSNSTETLQDWAAFFVLALIAAYLWSTVVKVLAD